jgi:hypothetical protein
MAEKYREFEFDEYHTRSSDYSSQDGRNNPQPNQILSDVSPAEARRIKLKIDARLVVLVGFMYCISLMDRTNLANAKAAGYANSQIMTLTRIDQIEEWRIKEPTKTRKEFLFKA